MCFTLTAAGHDMFAVDARQCHDKTWIRISLVCVLEASYPAYVAYCEAHARPAGKPQQACA